MLLDFFLVDTVKSVLADSDSELSCSSEDEQTSVTTIAPTETAPTPACTETALKVSKVATVLANHKPQKQYHYFLNGRLQGPATKKEIAALHSSSAHIWIKRANKAGAKWRKLKLKEGSLNVAVAQQPSLGELDMLDSAVVWSFASVAALHLFFCSMLSLLLVTMLWTLTKFIKFHLFGGEDDFEEKSNGFPLSPLRELCRLHPLTVLYNVPKVLFESSFTGCHSDRDSKSSKCEDKKGPKARKEEDGENSKEERKKKTNPRVTMMAYMVWGEASDLISLTVIAIVLFVLRGKSTMYNMLLFPVAIDFTSMGWKSVYHDGIDYTPLLQSLIADLLIIVLGLLAHPWCDTIIDAEQ